MTSKRLLAALSALAVAALAGSAVASAPTLTITSPRSGQSVQLHQNPYLAVAGDVSFASADPGSTTFYLRRDGCGTSNDNPHLSVTSGTDGGDGCGLIINSVTGLGGTVDQAAFVDFPSTDGMPLAFDSSRAVTGVIDLEGNVAGAVQVNVSMDALAGGQGVPIGSDTETVVADPASDTAVAFTIQPNSALAGADLQGIDLRVHIQGPAIDDGFIGLSGKSYVHMLSFAASVNQSVSVSVDDPTFANPVAARVDGSSWSVALATPAVGKHTLYARATQGFDTSSPATTTFTVKK